MGWDSGYLADRDNDARAAKQRAASEAQNRLKMTAFERRLLDHLGAMSTALARLVEFQITPLPPPVWETPMAGSARLAPIELDDVDLMAGVAALTDTFGAPFIIEQADMPRIYQQMLSIAVDAINGTRCAAGDGGAASAGPVPPPGSARPEPPTPGAAEDMGANTAAAAEMFPQHTRTNPTP